MKQVLRNYREVLALGPVRTVLLAAAVSVAGDSAAMVALLLRVHDSGAGPWAVSALLLAFAVPVVALMGVAGSLADRADPRRVLTASAAVQVIAALGLAAVDGLPATLGLVLVLQTAFALGNPSWTALVPRLVPEGSAGRVVALQQALRGLAGPLGAGAGGVLVQWHGPSTALLLDAASFLVLGAAALTLPRLGAPTPAGEGPPDGWRDRLLPRDGVVALRSDRVLGVLVLALLPMVVTLESVNVVEVFLVRDVLGASPAQFGAAEAVHGGAAVLGALAAGAASTRSARVRLVLWAIGLVGLGQVGQGLAPGYPVYLVAAAAVGVLLGVVNALVFALLLDELAAGHRGAVVALVSGLSRAAGALALGLGGVVGTLAGPRPAYLVAGLAGLLVAVVAAWAVHRSVDVTSTARASREAPGASTLEA
ncbi:MFS transporter [Phycicoccus sonneratiae]|uniref:MFS transporter n=1 Tax=Phycicoccus sonneratiae TaxID=2807628 RepID=A0ABS2CPG0_9MICO|nr:MFS transporter [Phycicoccus sonneraticus]MBM6401778.1 MFS transporter [Phycicoccus sonneraticus]